MVRVGTTLTFFSVSAGTCSAVRMMFLLLGRMIILSEKVDSTAWRISLVLRAQLGGKLDDVPRRQGMDMDAHRGLVADDNQGLAFLQQSFLDGFCVQLLPLEEELGAVAEGHLFDARRPRPG